MNAETAIFDRYQLHEQIGAGGMGVVWKATDQLLRQTVALKHVAVSTKDTEQAQLTRDRALREARLAAQLRDHPHVVSVYDALVDDGGIWLVMEYLPARSLGELLRNHGRLDPLHVARIGAYIADALAAGHALGIEHRDVKPGNVLITAEGMVKLTDYGISHLAGDAHLTHTGISGTPAYLAPEVAANGESSPASDVFSLGSTLYAAVEGQPPFGSDDNTLRLLSAVRNGIIRPPTAAGALEPLLLRLLQHDPSVRPDAATARHLLTRLAANLTDPTEQLLPQPGPISQALTPRSRTPASQPWWRHRRTAVAAAALAALVTAGAIGVNALPASSGETLPPPAAGPPSATTIPPTTKPPIPTRAKPAPAEPVADDSPTADPAPLKVPTTDPCALIDMEALNPFDQGHIARPPMRCPTAR
ncbi:MAG: serine/threonine-protein kinase [Pseudonocardiaceae bacterium]